ncbi:MAG TPA: AarF/UbiB family protein [Thermoanaerobaculia bacterium]|nr:AarF/UbiB family protein [Thermoanaerobaculia bacterium]
MSRYKDIATLLWKYGRGDIARSLDADAPPPAAGAEAPAKELARDLEELGPAYIKLGQILSTRADLLPSTYLDALSRLQDDVEPFPFERAKTIIEEELGVRLSKAFSAFDPTPIAAASLGQVYRAALRDGRPVAVKVQRPDIESRIEEDGEAFEEIADLVDRHVRGGRDHAYRDMVAEFRKVLATELDYLQEANNLKAIGAELADFPLLVIPRPYDDYTSRRVLTMEYVEGTKITGLHPVVLIDVDTERLADELFRGYLKQVLLDGLFHADPHPGNVLLTSDHRLALVDLGMVGRLSSEVRDRLLRFLLAASEGHGERAAEAVVGIARPSEDARPDDFRRAIAELVQRYAGSTVGDLQMGRVLLEISRLSAETGMALPPELSTVGKTLLHLDLVGRTLAPDFDPNASIRRYSAELMSRRMRQEARPGNVFATLLEAKDFVGKLPERAGKILDLAAENGLRLKVDAIDEHLLIEGLHKIANRIALGLVLASLIVGAALLMHVPTRFQILGYPGLAMVFFLGAAAGGVALAASIVFGDATRRDPDRRRG